MGTRRRERIGIFGGTFNPVHIGHLLVAQDALETARLDRVIFVPCAQPPHKPGHDVVAARHRRAMLRRAVAGDPRFAVDDLELRRGGTSYTIDTVQAFRQRYPGAALWFILGADSLAELHLWRDVNLLVRLCGFIAVPRPGAMRAGGWRALVAPGLRRHLRLRVVAGHACAVASRELRARVRRGDSIRYLVPAPVLRYIARQQLYR